MGRAIEESVLVRAAREELFERLALLENHWDLADRWVEVVSLNGAKGSPANGGVVRLHGPLGLSRTAETAVDSVRPPSLITGTARVGPRTLGRVSWSLDGDGGETRVTLRGELVEAGPLDRAVWSLGGRRWMQRRLRITLERLRAEYSGEAQR